jgi:hypothetical protein
LFVFSYVFFFSIENMLRKEKKHRHIELFFWTDEPSNNIMSIIRLIGMWIFSSLIESKFTNTHNLDYKSIEKKKKRKKNVFFSLSIILKSTNAIKYVSQIICCYLIRDFRQVLLK